MQHFLLCMALPARTALRPASSICLQWFASKHIFIIVFIYPVVCIGFIGQSGTVNGLGFCGGSAGCNSVNVQLRLVRV